MRIASLNNLFFALLGALTPFFNFGFLRTIKLCLGCGICCFSLGNTLLNFIKFSGICRRQFIGAPIGQIKTLMCKNIAPNRCTARQAPRGDITTRIVKRAIRPPRLITKRRAPHFGLCNPEIVALHDLGGIVTILNCFPHLGDGAFKKTGIVSRLGNRKNPVPFGPELIPSIQLFPHTGRIAVVEKIILLCTSSARVPSRMSGCREDKKANNHGI